MICCLTHVLLTHVLLTHVLLTHVLLTHVLLTHVLCMACYYFTNERKLHGPARVKFNARRTQAFWA